jgi:DNA processing protein
VPSLEETAALVALLRRGDASWADITDRVEQAGSALALLGQGDGQPDQPALFPSPDEDLTLILAEIAAWRAEGLQLLSVLDDEYPRRLRLIHERPPLLWTRGRLAMDDLAVAVVGTRNPTQEGVRLATEIAGGIALRGVTVVSGLAAGIDTAAHRAALEAGGRTVAVIGTGIRRFYPAFNAGLQRRIGESGLVLSQFWPDAPPTKTTFPMRNATMSGYSLATVVVEAAERSGARMQARFALEHGRHVFLLRSLLAHDWARNYAQRPNTTVVDGPQDVFDKLEHLRSTIDDLAWT